MPSVGSNEVRVRDVILHQGGIWRAVKIAHVKPGKGGAFNQMELKNLVTGSKLNERFRSEDKVDRVSLDRKDFQFLYEQDDLLVFMDEVTYEQIELRKDFKSCVDNAKRRKRADESCDPDSLGRLEKALGHMAGSHNDKIEISSLAKLCGMSQTHFRRVFKQTLGKSPVDYLNQLRIASAMAELDRSQRPISEIALSCGFTTLSSFNRQFRRIACASPRQWRRRNR